MDLKLLKQIEYASRKDSLIEHERLLSVRSLVTAAISRAATKSAPRSRASHNIGERLPKSDPAEGGADTTELREALEACRTFIDDIVGAGLLGDLGTKEAKELINTASRTLKAAGEEA